MYIESKSESSLNLAKEFTTPSITSDEEKLLQGLKPSPPSSSRALPAPYSDWFNMGSFSNISWTSDISQTVKHMVNSLGEYAEELWSPTAEDQRRSEAIDRYLDEESRNRDRQLRVALFGDNEQKDILWKHVRLLGQPLSAQERCDLLPEVRRVVLNLAMDVLIQIDEELSTRMTRKDSVTEQHPLLSGIREILVLGAKAEGVVDRILALSSEPFHVQLAEHGLNIEGIYWKTHLLDGSGFFSCPCNDSKNVLKLLERVYSAEYCPTDHDFLHFDRRLSPTMIREASIKMEGYSIHLLDPIRNCCERRKWIHVLEKSTGTIFVADIAHYDKCLFEDESRTLLDEQIILFESIFYSKWMAGPILLVLSNITPFKSKLETSSLSLVYPDYKGGNYADAIAYITSLFLQKSCGRSDIHTFHIDAFDRQQVRKMVDYMRGTVLMPALTKLGLSKELT